MAAIFEEFANGDAFNASDFNTYSMRQANIACDNQTDRDSIATPQEGMTVYRKDLNAFQTYDGSAWFTRPILTPSFRAYKSGTITANATPAKVTLDAETFDYGSNFNTTTNRFVAPYEGVYHFDAHGLFTTPGDGNSCRVYIYKNGAALTDYSENMGVNVGGANSTDLHIGATIGLAASDYIEVYVTRATGSGNANGSLSGHLVQDLRN